MNGTAEVILRDYDTALARIVLHCVRELPFQMGARRIVGLLRGSHAQFVIDHELYKLNVFGVL